MLAIGQKRIVVVGSRGRLGATLTESLARCHAVIPLAKEDLDMRSPESIRSKLLTLDYDMVIIAGALTAVDYCEKHADEAFQVNAEGPGEIARISAEKGAHVTYFSTDFVYDGSRGGPYSEDDSVNPINVYGKSKWMGEVQVMAASARNLVVRVSWLFGPGRAAFPEWVIAKACREGELSLPADKIGCPTSTIDLVQWMVPLLFGDDGHAVAGIFHLCNSQPCTWREWGEFCVSSARTAGLPVLGGAIVGVPLASVAGFDAIRPLNSAMSTEKFTHLTGITPRGWQEATRSFLESSDLLRKHVRI
jgi:dTDP-4-dehydrorhamnose reductase